MTEKTESKIQQECFVWFNNTYCLKHHKNRCMIFAVPNGGKRDAREAKALKNTGVVSGVSDLIVLMPSKTIFVEIKKPNGIQSDTQKVFMQRVKALAFEYYIARSLEDFKNIIALCLTK